VRGNDVITQKAQIKQKFMLVDPKDPKLKDLTLMEFNIYRDYIIQRAAREAKFYDEAEKRNGIENVRAALNKFNKEEKAAQTPQIKEILKKVIH
jgi:hypothetical protein